MKYKFFHCDDYRTGPKLHIKKWVDNDAEDEDDISTFTVDIDITENFVVYHAMFGENVKFKRLKEFVKLESAVAYAKTQYYLYTGDYPFIVDGMTSAYKSTGHRPEFKIEENMVCEIPDDPEKDFYVEYIIISNGLTVEAHSLNEYAEW